MATTKNVAADSAAKRALISTGITAVLVGLASTVLIVIFGVAPEVLALENSEPWTYGLATSTVIMVMYGWTMFTAILYWNMEEVGQVSRIIFGALHLTAWCGWLIVLGGMFGQTAVSGIPALIAFISAVAISIDVARIHRAVEPEPVQDVQDEVQDIQDAVRNEPEYPQDAPVTD